MSPTRRMPNVVWLALVLSPLMAAIALAFPRPAGAFVYWGDTGHYALGRSALDGRGATESFVKLSFALPCGVAVSGPYIYWGDRLTGDIGRARIDGSGTPNPRFIVGPTEPCGLAAFGGHLYWVNQTIYGSIGRASLSGPLNVQENFVPSEQASAGQDLWEPCAVAVDSTGIYWSNRVGGGVGHANLDGTAERTLLDDSGWGCGVALGGDYVYWVNHPWVGSAMIGRALKSGTDANDGYMAGLGGPCGLAILSHTLVFADGSVIDTTDLSSPNPTSDTGQIFMDASSACGVAVDSLFQGRLTVLASYAQRRQATLRLRVSGAGQLVVDQLTAGQRLVQTTRTAARAAGPVSVILRPTAAGLATLRAGRVLKVAERVVYTPSGGIDSTGRSVAVLKP